MPKNSEGYKHYYAPVDIDPIYPNGQRRAVISTDEEMSALIEAIADMEIPAAALDTETTGLSAEHDKLAGISIATSREESFYIPVGHYVGQNVSMSLALKFVAYLSQKVKRLFFYNASFDLRFLRAAGLENHIELSKVPFFDVMALSFNSDTNVKMPSLKKSVLHFVGWKMRTFEEALGDASNFAYNDPKDCYEYPCDDALGTFALAESLQHVYKECSFICKLDNAATLPVMSMEDRRTRINRDWLAHLKEDVINHMMLLETQIYGYAGKNFAIGSPKQLVDVLATLGIRPNKTTSKGAVSTKEEALMEIADQHPILPLIVDYKKTIKLKSSYVETLYDQWREDLGGGRFGYMLYNVPTGRFASGSEKKNPYYYHVNVQSIPKPKTAMYRAEFVGYDVPGNILGWVFTEDPNGPYEGLTLKNNVRHAFIPEDGHLWISLDYSGQELRVAANMAKEPIWIKTFLANGDLHRNMAVSVYGEENYSGDLRKKMKAINFGALYGGSEYTFSLQLQIPLHEAKELLDGWWSKLKKLRSWTRSVYAEGRKKGFVTSPMGRPRRVRFWSTSPNFRDRSFAERTMVNTKIQGFGGDLMRFAFVDIDRKCKPWIKEGSLNVISTVHDEINLSMLYDSIEGITEKILKIVDIMQVKFPGWEVPLEVGIEVGTSWGYCFKFHMEDGKWVPTPD